MLRLDIRYFKETVW